ncbi:MAG: hypothetical protein VXZ16_05160 [Bacteroidota bacterium]|nr:hypothetical protein [Bacteroidota bacterium]
MRVFAVMVTMLLSLVFSPFYDNQAELYHAGEFRKQRMDRADIESVMTSRAFLRSKR